MITVLMTVYNGERWIRASVASVLDQTFERFELLVVDDGSTDATPDILAKFARQDDRVRVITQKNCGVVRAANRGMQEARYDWIARLDADDVAYPERLERQLAFIAQHPDLVVGASDANYINEAGDVIGQTCNPFTNPERVRRQIANDNAVYFIHSSMIFRRDVILDLGGYREQFRLTHDTDLWNRVAERGHLIITQPEALVDYRIHYHGMTRHGFRRLAEELRWMEHCARRRRLDRPELTLEQYRAAMHRASLLRRANAWRRDVAYASYKAGTAACAERDAASLVGYVALSTALDPAPALGSIWRKAVGPQVRRLAHYSEVS